MWLLLSPLLFVGIFRLSKGSCLLFVVAVFMNRTRRLFFLWLLLLFAVSCLLIVYLVLGQRLTGGERRAGGGGENRRLRWRCSRVLCAFPEKGRRWS